MDGVIRQCALLVTASSIVIIAPFSAASAQDRPAAATAVSDEIIVTARKREESILNVPVIETAIPRQQIERLHTVNVSDLPSIVPGLTIGHAQGPVGTLVSIRGVGAISSDQGVDTSVSLNIDGLSLGNGVAFNSGLFDLQQIEVLKGPQALFYGKSSPGGVISLRTADPTDDFEVSLRGSYEFEARTPRIEAIFSGPVSNTLKLRLASMYQTSDGYFHNIAQAVAGTGAVSPTDRREPGSRNWMIRGTALWSPTDTLSARLKVNFVHDRIVNSSTAQLANCPEGPGFAPSGIPFIGGDDCKLDRNLRVVYADPANFPTAEFGGVPTLSQDQKYGTLEINFQPHPTLTLTSTTAYYKLDQNTFLNATNSTAAGPALGVNIDFHRRAFTEELRLNSNLSGPLNFTLGALYEDGQINNRPALLGNTAYKLPVTLSDVQEYVDIKTYSAFGQLRWQLTPQLELAAGGRFTDESRDETPYSWITGSPVFVQLGVPHLHSSNFAPEVTLTFKPTDDMTLFASYKQAYKSGSFSLGGVPRNGGNDSFGDEKVEGGEIGLKSRLFDRQVTLNLAGYYYDYHGLQVGAIEPAAGNLTVTRTENAGAARSYGVDFDFGFRPNAIEGLSLRGAVSWNHARYLELNNIPCYGGQTIALGCNQPPVVAVPGVGPTFTAQDLSGTPMVRAPAWQINGGFDYEKPIGHDLTMTFTGNVSYSSKYVTYLAVARPNDDQYQRAYAKLDLGIGLRGPDDHWQVSLIGKNLTDKLIASSCNASNYANGALFAGQISGATVSGPAGIGQTGCNTDAGREVVIVLNTRF